MPAAKKAVSPLDPELARRALLQAIDAHPDPTPSSALATLPELGRKLPAKQVDQLLAGEIQSGSLFVWRIAGKKAFWRQGPEAISRERLLTTSANELLARAALEKNVAAQKPALAASAVKQAREALVQEGLLREATAAASKKTKYLINTKHPEPYLLSEIASLLTAYGLPRPVERIRTLLSEQEAPAGPPSDVRGVADKLFAAMNRIAFAPGTTVTFYRLRQQPELANIPKEAFDKAAFLLEKERKAVLSLHGHGAALPDEERQHLVTDGLGKYYVSIYVR